MNLAFDNYFEQSSFSTKGVSSILQIKEQIVNSLGGFVDNVILLLSIIFIFLFIFQFFACQLSSNGLCTILAKDCRINTGDKLSEYTIVEIPKFSEQHEKDLIIVIVTHIAGYFPAGLRLNLLL